MIKHHTVVVTLWYNPIEVTILNKQNFNYNFDNVFGYRELLTQYLCECGLPKEEAFCLSEKVRKGYFYNKKYTHPKIPEYVTDCFSKVKYLPSIRRLTEYE